MSMLMDSRHTPTATSSIHTHDFDMYTDNHCALNAASAKRMRSPAQAHVAVTPTGALCHTYKRQRALQPLPGLQIACHSALAAEACGKRLAQDKRPSEGATPAKMASHRYHTRPGPVPDVFHGSPVQRVGSCFEPYVNIGQRRRAFDAGGPGPSVLANSSSVLTPVDTCTSTVHSQHSGHAARLVFHDAAQQVAPLPSLPARSLSSSVATLQLASLEVDPSWSSLLDDNLVKEQPPEGRGAGTSPCAFPVSNTNSSHPLRSPCMSQPVAGIQPPQIIPSPTIITDGAHVLEVSPRSLVTPRKSQAPPELSAQQGALRKQGSVSTPDRTTNSHMVPFSSHRGVCRYRRRTDSPSDDEGAESPMLPGGLLTPQCMATASVLQTDSPAEHQRDSAAGSGGGGGNTGRLVCNLIDRFNNTQLYDGINESPQLAAAQLVRSEAE